jgi:DNA-binding response OmpR family regulator
MRDATPAAMIHASRPARGPLVALVIEDDPATRQLLIHALRPLGVHGIGFASGEAALAWTELNQTPDLITVDISLPAMCGIRVCEWLRTLPRMRDVPIIVITGRCDVQDIAAALDVGAAYLAKPFRLRELGDIVAPLLRPTSP